MAQDGRAESKLGASMTPDFTILVLFTGNGEALSSTTGAALLVQIISKRLSIIGSSLRARPKQFKAELVQEFAEFAVSRFADGTFKPIVDKTFPLAQAKEAHQYLESKKNKGKVILTN